MGNQQFSVSGIYLDRDNDAIASYSVVFLLGLYFLLVYNEKQKSFLVVSMLSVTLSLFSKESSIFYLITYSLIIWFSLEKN